MSKIVIIDDALIMRMRLKEVIEKNNQHQVIGEAQDGEMGVKVCEQHKPDIVTLDISMPGLDGLETLKRILTNNENIKVIMVSAVGQKQMIIEALTIGAKDFITKPFEPEQLVQTINKLSAF